jgi:enamine deaminase RidA (YjgF/YER057c/UK114 family)
MQLIRREYFWLFALATGAPLATKLGHKEGRSFEKPSQSLRPDRTSNHLSHSSRPRNRKPCKLDLTQLLTRILGATLIMIGCATAQTADVQFSNPPTIAKPTGYTHVVEVKGPNRTIYIAGQLGYDAAGKQGTDFREQATLVYENLKAAVESVGGKMDKAARVSTSRWGLATMSRRRYMLTSPH